MPPVATEPTFTWSPGVCWPRVSAAWQLRALPMHLGSTSPSSSCLRKGPKFRGGSGQTQAAQDRPGRGPQQGEHSPHRQCHSAVPGTVGQAARGKQEGGEGQWSHGKLIYSRGHVRLLLLRPDLHLPAATDAEAGVGWGGVRAWDNNTAKSKTLEKETLNFGVISKHLSRTLRL